MPKKSASYSDNLRVGAEIYYHLKQTIASHSGIVLVGDEGGYSPTLYWYLGSYGIGFTYEIEVVQGDTTNLTGTPTAVNIPSFSYSLSGLDADTKYSWHVRSKSGSAYSAWSKKVSFKTVQGAAGPVKPILAWPINDALVYTTATSLHWYIETDGTGLTYELEYVEGESFDLSGTPNIFN
ncbi:MAG: Enolase, partial [Microgenomates group bacterium GW2011_GWA2_46_7]